MENDLSPDFNIIEDGWKRISDQVYDGKQFETIKCLRESIKNVILEFNRDKRDKLCKLIQFYRDYCKLFRKKEISLINDFIVVTFYG